MSDLSDAITFTVQGRPPPKAGSGSPLGARSRYRGRAVAYSKQHVTKSGAQGSRASAAPV
jgi:hypothetical protein